MGKNIATGAVLLLMAGTAAFVSWLFSTEYDSALLWVMFGTFTAHMVENWWDAK
jgi:hypothetical protein